MKSRQLNAAGPRPQPEPALDQRQIVRTAMEVLDESGFDRLTMRSLAEKLGIKAASLYWHVRSKQDLLSQLADEICAPMTEPDRNLPWTDQLESLAHEYRHILLAHRDAVRVLSSSGPPIGPNRLRLTEILLRILLDAGFDHQDAAHAGSLLANYVPMFVLDETQAANGEAEGGAEAPSSGAQNWIAALPQNEYPHLTSLADQLQETSADELFQFGITVLRDGLEARLSKRAGGAP